MNIKNNLILALDVMSGSEAIEICDSIKEYIDKNQKVKNWTCYNKH